MASTWFGVDLGADKVNVLNLDHATGVFSPNTVPFAPVAPSGRRSMMPVRMEFDTEFGVVTGISPNCADVASTST